MLETILALGTSIGAALAWLWNESRRAKKEAEERFLGEIEREHTYATRLEARLKARDEEIERLMLRIINNNPEDVMKSIISGDPGVSWVKKRLSRDNYVVVCVSAGLARLGTLNARSEEEVYTSGGMSFTEPLGEGIFVGRKFPVNGYVVGIGNYEVNK